MDTLPSPGRDDAITSQTSSPLDPSEDGSKVESPVFKLPTELIILVFQSYRSFTRPPITVTHTCRRWRQIAINDASLWTRIFIQTHQPRQRLDSFLSFLSMQFDRAAGLLLDVTWHAVFADEAFLATLRLIREKAPFSQWRTLLVDFSRGANREAHWSSVDAFTNLESLTVWDCTEDTILGLIDCTITSRLKILHLPSLNIGIMTTLAKSLTRVSSLHVKAITLNRNTAFLPANIKNLRLGAASIHPFPLIRTYGIRECIFFQGSSIDLRNMTTFTVKGRLTIHCEVFLPALRELTLGTLRICDNADVEAPALNHLHFRDCDDWNMRISFTDEALMEPGYLLSPNTSIIVDSYLPITSLINLLTKSPKITHATLRFKDPIGAQAVLYRLVRIRPQTDSRSSSVELCPRLSELSLDFGWAIPESSVSKEWILDRLRARKEAGVTPPLSIYVGWKGEGTYVLLTGD